MSNKVGESASTSSRSTPAQELDAVVETAYRAGFDDGLAAAREGPAPKVDPDRARLAVTRAAALTRAATTAMPMHFRKRKKVDGEHEPGRSPSLVEDEPDENAIYTDEDLEIALTHYRNHRNRLERDHFNQYVTVDIATGQMAVAASASEAI